MSNKDLTVTIPDGCNLRDHNSRNNKNNHNNSKLKLFAKTASQNLEANKFYQNQNLPTTTAPLKIKPANKTNKPTHKYH